MNTRQIVALASVRGNFVDALAWAGVIGSFERAEFVMALVLWRSEGATRGYFAAESIAKDYFTSHRLIVLSQRALQVGGYLDPAYESTVQEDRTLGGWIGFVSSRGQAREEISFACQAGLARGTGRCSITSQHCSLGRPVQAERLARHHHSPIQCDDPMQDRRLQFCRHQLIQTRCTPGRRLRQNISRHLGHMTNLLIPA